jgi:hypothetical protein
MLANDDPTHRRRASPRCGPGPDVEQPAAEGERDGEAGEDSVVVSRRVCRSASCDLRLFVFRGNQTVRERTLML